MPFSNQESIPTVLYFAGLVKPRRILDAGVGLGVYGLLFRTVFDVACERVAREAWQIRIDGIEIFEGYRNPVWDYAYDEVRMGDIRTFALEPNSYDLVLIADVLEHMTEEEAHRCVGTLLKAAPTVIATTPIHYIPQGAWGDNLQETHISVIDPRSLPGFVCSKATGQTCCVVCCRDPKLAKSLGDESGNAPGTRRAWGPYIRYRLIRKWNSFRRLRRKQ